MAVTDLLHNLHLLGFDPPRHALGSYAHLTFDEGLFTTNTDTHKAFEVTSHFLFHQLDPTRTRNSFGNCWPADEHRHSREYRTVAYKWLDELRLAGKFVGRVVLRRSMLEDCRGERMTRLMVTFSTFVLQKAFDCNYWQANAQHIRLDSLPKSPENIRLLQRNLKEAIANLAARLQLQKRKSTSSPRRLPSSSSSTTPQRPSSSIVSSSPQLNLTTPTNDHDSMIAAKPSRSVTQTKTPNDIDRHKDTLFSPKSAATSSIKKHTITARRGRLLYPLLKEHPVSNGPAPEWILPRLVSDNSSPEALARVRSALLRHSTGLNAAARMSESLTAIPEKTSQRESSIKVTPTPPEEPQPPSPTPSHSVTHVMHSERNGEEHLFARPTGLTKHDAHKVTSTLTVESECLPNTNVEVVLIDDELEKVMEPDKQMTKPEQGRNLWSDGLSPVEAVWRPNESTSLLSSPLSKLQPATSSSPTQRLLPSRLALKNSAKDILAYHNPQQFRAFLKQEDGFDFDWYENVYTRSPSLKIPSRDADLDKYPKSMRSGPFVTRYDPSIYRTNTH